MAYDDYFVVVAKLLSYLYSCMKQGIHPNPQEYSYTAYGINREYCKRILDDLLEERYIKTFGTTENQVKQELINGGLTITAKGIEYLHDANVIHRALLEIKQIGGAPADVIEFLGL